MLCHGAMTRQTLDNDHYIIVYAFSLLIRCFKEEDYFFAAQCIWWLTSMVQNTKIFRLYLEYQIFPSEYIENCDLTPLLKRVPEVTITPESDIPVLLIDADTEYRFK